MKRATVFWGTGLLGAGLLSIALVGCMEQPAKIAALERAEYERFCNHDPEHPRCERDSRV